MKKRWIGFLVAGLLPIWLFATSVDEKLLDANVSVYQKLLSKLEKERESTDSLQKSLQTALLQQIISLQKHPPRRSPIFDTLLSQHPSDANGIRLFFRNIMLASTELQNSKMELTKLDKKLETLKSDLSKPESGKENHQTLQFQYIYTFHLRQRLQQRIHEMEETFDKLPVHILSIIENIDYPIAPIFEDLRQIEMQTENLQRSAEDLTMEKKRLALLGNAQVQIQQLQKWIGSILHAREQLLRQKAGDQAILFAKALKDRDKRAFELAKEIETTLKEIGHPSDTISHISDIILSVSRQRFGLATTLGSAAGQEIDHTLQLVGKQLNAPIFAINGTPISPFKILITIFVFSLGIFIGILYKRLVRNFRSHNLTEATRTLLSNMGYYLIVVIAFFVALHFLGIDLGSLALVAGALSVGIGFGLQNIVSNFISGIILMFERSIKIGDYIELDETLRGRVTDIRMRSITITTNANIDIIVPNQDLIQNRVINWTMKDKIRRFEIPFGVAYGTEPSRVISAVLEAVGRSGYEDIYSSSDRQTQVVMTGMGDSSVDFTLFVWIKGQKTLQPKRTTSRFLILIYNALYDAGIEIPFPQRDLHIRSVDGAIPLAIDREETVSRERGKSDEETKESGR
jgi:small-conductance mechanosensitive channel